MLYLAAGHGNVFGFLTDTDNDNKAGKLVFYQGYFNQVSNVVKKIQITCNYKKLALFAYSILHAIIHFIIDTLS